MTEPVRAMEGTVFDIGYRQYEGIRQGRWRSRFSVYKDGFRNAIGLGRDIKAKAMPGIFFGVLVLIAVVMALVAGAALRFGGPQAFEQLELPWHSNFYGIASIIIFVFGSVVGPELLCPDRRNGTINLYLVRQLTGADYVLMRWAAFFTVMLVVAIVPQLVLLIGMMMGNPDPTGYFLERWLDLPRILASGAAIAAYTTTIVMFAASFTTRRAYASVFLIGLFAITTPFTAGVAQEIEGPVGQWISMFNLSNVPVHVNDIIFNDVSDVTEAAPAGTLPRSVLVGWYLLWTFGPLAVMWKRYARLTP